MRVESATVTGQADLPIHVTKDWVSLDSADTIEVPEDAWADWDPVEQRWITVGEKFPDGATANIKSVVVYPGDLFEKVTWHDGSHLSAGDFMMAMILTFDLGKPDSPYFEPVSQPTVEAFLSTFKGVKVTSMDPLTIETYTDTWYTDAELNVTTWWPYYAYGQAPWHTMALGLMAQEAETLAFSADKALELEVEQMSFLSGPSIDVLKTNLDTATAENYIPFAEVMGEVVTADEATARYTNLNEWFRRRGHFWVTTGPYFLQRAFPIEGTIILEHNPAYPDSADRWAAYSTPAFPVATVDGPTEVKIGDEASYTVNVTFNDEPYAAEDISRVVYLVFDAEGNLVLQGDAEGGDNGTYTVAFDTSELSEGSNRLQVIVVSKLVGVPVFVNQTFVTTQ
jgi:peptide/nickel transport system substrate-binding protein